MKIIVRSAPVGAPYEKLVGKEVHVMYNDPAWGTNDFIVKNGPYYEGQNNLLTIPFGDAVITDMSGSEFEDGLELGMKFGKHDKAPIKKGR
ncbi:hypothetical protein MKY98_08005 [Paenibacillus sp. FSL M8-0228]|uniref:hypothetical protein n=1 Tax=Paenibacillus sp. FSL M8-0228 TaxID=2921620 RepID=UPI0030F7FF16